MLLDEDCIFSSYPLRISIPMKTKRRKTIFNPFLILNLQKGSESRLTKATKNYFDMDGILTCIYFQKVSFLFLFAAMSCLWRSNLIVRRKRVKCLYFKSMLVKTGWNLDDTHFSAKTHRFHSVLTFFHFKCTQPNQTLTLFAL